MYGFSEMMMEEAEKQFLQEGREEKEIQSNHNYFDLQYQLYDTTKENEQLQKLVEQLRLEIKKARKNFLIIGKYMMNRPVKLGNYERKQQYLEWVKRLQIN